MNANCGVVTSDWNARRKIRRERQRHQRERQPDQPGCVGLEPGQEHQNQAPDEREQDRDRQQCRHPSILAARIPEGQLTQCDNNCVRSTKMKSRIATESAETAA